MKLNEDVICNFYLFTGTITCKEGGCSCDDGSVFGGFIGSGLPVQNVVLDPSTSDRELHIGPLKCYGGYFFLLLLSLTYVKEIYRTSSLNSHSMYF